MTTPGRDLVLLDAMALLVALIAAVAVDAAVDGELVLALGYVATQVREALPLSIAAVLVCFSTAGIYETRDGAPIARLASSLAWATALVAFASIYWGSPPFGARFVVIAFAFELVAIIACRAIYSSVALSGARPSSD